MNDYIRPIEVIQTVKMPESPSLVDMSQEYTAEAQRISDKLRVLRRDLRACMDSQERLRLSHKVYVLSKVLTQARDLAEFTARYHDPSYIRKEEYCGFKYSKKPSRIACVEDDLDALFEDEY